jgi:hypothetical protein
MRTSVMVFREARLCFLLLGLALSGTAADGRDTVGIGAEATYVVLPVDARQAPPFEVVRFRFGPEETKAAGLGRWWEVSAEARADGKSVPLVEVRALTHGDPLAEGRGPLEFVRYQLRFPALGETFEYRDMHTDQALLPCWGDFARHFFPQAARGSGRRDGFPETCEYLGHVLSLHSTSSRGSWPEWPGIKRLDLDDELLVGASRECRDAEGRRVAPGKDYTYVPFTGPDYEKMRQAGMNYFGLAPGVEAQVRAAPVFYRRADAGDRPLEYPADFYRSNFRGSVMFEDEPACIMVGDKRVHTQLKHFSDATTLLERRVQAAAAMAPFRLEQQLRARGISFGAMRLAEVDYPVWETRYETAFYQLEAGAAGFVHEGRYHLRRFSESEATFDDWVGASTGIRRAFTGEEMLRIHYAFLRGAARQFDRTWGTSIYGQADTNLAPLALTLAYDMGARYLWFWTSDHDHHVPWPEQLELARKLRDHARAHPRPSIKQRPLVDTAIVIPYGSLLVLESPTGRKNPWDLWWVHDLDKAGVNEASRAYQEFRRRAFTEIIRALDAHEDFDLAVDNGSPPRGYRKVIRVER